MLKSYEDLLDSVPAHLQQYVVRQNYHLYTPRDHAVWRYIMRKNIEFLGRHAHPAYLSGLKKTGITLDSIPEILEMNRKLSDMGWRAVVVNGFIPPAAFMEFQAHKILVISAEMRTIGHILYTPAPDIVHEAAGHAPLIADEAYAQYLQKFGEYGAKAMASKLDFEVYDAIRSLSIIKEYPDATPEQVKEAEDRLAEKQQANTVVSEAAKLSRLHWWTVEYGLVGSVDDFRQYGAGLLSSVGESKACMDPKVRKIPHDIRCVDYDYDITSMQPQLFVAEDWYHLMDVLEEFADTMCFRTGGIGGLQEAIAAENVTTMKYASGLQVSGTLKRFLTDEQKRPSYIQTRGPTALACDYRELNGHGIKTHKNGFGSPVGRLKAENRPLESMSPGDLERIGIVPGRSTEMIFDSGISVAGKVDHVKRNDDRLILISLENCTVRHPDGTVLFSPDLGRYDMAVGADIVSVFAGTADKTKFNVLPPKSDRVAMSVSYSDEDKNLFDMYRQVREVRKGSASAGEISARIFREVEKKYPDEWLIRLELLELSDTGKENGSVRDRILDDLERIRQQSDELDQLIGDGLALVNSG